MGSITPSPFNIFQLPQSMLNKKFKADYTSDREWFEEGMQNAMDNCSPIRTGIPSRQPWELPENTAEIISLPESEQYCQTSDGNKLLGFNETSCTAVSGSGQTWITEECRFVYKQHMLKETPSIPLHLPTGWRVTPSGHLTNLPADLDVSDRTDALKNGVGVITEAGLQYNTKGILEEVDYDSTKIDGPIINPVAYNAIVKYSHPQPSFKSYMPCVWTELNNMDNIDEVFTEEDCRDDDYIAWSWHRTLAPATLQDNIDKLMDRNSFSLRNLNKQYWWVEAPLFRGGCPDENYEEYVSVDDAAGVIDYWDDTHCNTEITESTGSKELPWMIIGSIGVIAITAFAANSYLKTPTIGGTS